MKKSISILILALLFVSCEKEKPCEVVAQSEERLFEYDFTAQHQNAEKSVTLNGDTLTENLLNVNKGDTLVFRANQFPSGYISITASQNGEQIASSYTVGLNLYKMIIIE